MMTPHNKGCSQIGSDIISSLLETIYLLGTNKTPLIG